MDTVFGTSSSTSFGELWPTRSSISLTCWRLSSSGRKLRMISDRCVERAVVASTTVYPAVVAVSRWSALTQMAGRPNAGSRVCVPSSGRVAVPGLIASSRSA